MTFAEGVNLWSHLCIDVVHVLCDGSPLMPLLAACWLLHSVLSFFFYFLFRRELPFIKTAHLSNPWNEHKPVKIGRDGQVS